MNAWNLGDGTGMDANLSQYISSKRGERWDGTEKLVFHTKDGHGLT